MDYRSRDRLGSLGGDNPSNERYFWCDSTPGYEGSNSKAKTARLIRVFTAFYARYYTGWTPEHFRSEIAKNVYVPLSLYPMCTNVINKVFT